jgi:hypothetical protein
MENQGDKCTFLVELAKDKLRDEIPLTIGGGGL